MYLTHLSLTNFRAFARLDLNVPRRLVLLVGGNAQGKTSLLEAIYYLATFTSFHAHNDRQLINFLAAREPLAVARIVAEYQRGLTAHRLEVRIIQESTGNNGSNRLRKEILLDGVKRPLNEGIGHFNAVIFLPHMARIIEEGPEERRRYLNLALSQATMTYAQALSEYNQALNQRNALLKQLSERGGDAEQLVYWDEIITRRGAQIILARIQAVHELERLSRRIHHRLTHSTEVLRLSYQPAYDPMPQPAGQYSLPITTSVDRTGLSLEQIRQGFSQKLVALRSEEIARGLTTIGPHRDELRFLSNGVDLGDYGSRGQVRTTLLALKLAEVAWLREKTGQWPVLLLDEILAELDNQRRLDLLEFLKESEQAMLTTTDLNLFSADFVTLAETWQIQSGAVVLADGSSSSNGR
ncbi:MAG: DNA replication and repair protein RecF [Anaerolineaceae bacterium]|nr:DNA replication and repair protein RecF [Anaerolineaceae bacterium]